MHGVHRVHVLGHVAVGSTFLNNPSTRVSLNTACNTLADVLLAAPVSGLLWTPFLQRGQTDTQAVPAVPGLTVTRPAANLRGMWAPVHRTARQSVGLKAWQRDKTREGPNIV